MDIIYSYVIPVYNEEPAWPALESALEGFLKTFPKPGKLEFVLVDDGSNDGSWERMARLAYRLPEVQSIRLARNFGHQTALLAGYFHARGQAILSLDADLQDPLAVTLEMIEEWEKGYDIVYGVRTKRAGEPWWRLRLIGCFYWFYRTLVQKETLNSGDFRLISRPVLEVLLRIPERSPYLRGLVSWIGMKSTRVFYERKPRIAGESKYPLKKLLRLAMDGFFSMSFQPFYVIWKLGIGLWILLLGIGLLLLGIRSSTLSINTFLAISFFLLSGIFFVLLGVLGVYLERVQEGIKGRPRFFVRERIQEGVYSDEFKIF